MTSLTISPPILSPICTQRDKLAALQSCIPLYTQYQTGAIAGRGRASLSCFWGCSCQYIRTSGTSWAIAAWNSATTTIACRSTHHEQMKQPRQRAHACNYIYNEKHTGIRMHTGMCTRNTLKSWDSHWRAQYSRTDAHNANNTHNSYHGGSCASRNVDRTWLPQTPGNSPRSVASCRGAVTNCCTTSDMRPSFLARRQLLTLWSATSMHRSLMAVVSWSSRRRSTSSADNIIGATKDGAPWGKANTTLPLLGLPAARRRGSVPTNVWWAATRRSLWLPTRYTAVGQTGVNTDDRRQRDKQQGPTYVDNPGSPTHLGDAIKTHLCE